MRRSAVAVKQELRPAGSIHTLGGVTIMERDQWDLLPEDNRLHPDSLVVVITPEIRPKNLGQAWHARDQQQALIIADEIRNST
jgi:hypothetical protein